MKTRSSFVIRNITTGIGSKVLMMVLAFANRTVFIRLLGADYTGVNGLFTNILSILSLADLGIDSVLTYKLFGALKDHDEDRIAFLVQRYRRIYFTIGAIILGLGMSLIPFLQLFVKSELEMGTIRLYYSLHVLNSAASYFFVHKTIVLIADQKRYYDNLVTTVTQMFMYLVQVIYLYLTRDYIGYLVIQVFFTILKNAVLTFIANFKYPYLNKKVEFEGGDFDIRDVIADTKATFMYKAGGVLLNHTDNILISVILGTVFVGYYSNYYLLIQYIAAYIFVFCTGTLASVGNLNAEQDIEKSRKVFMQLHLLFAFLAAVSSSAFFCSVQDLVVIWIGEKYLVELPVVIAILALFFGNTLFFPTRIARETMGLFKEVRFIMIPAVLINLVLSFVLGYTVGMAGILFATSISKAMTIWWFEPVIVCRKYGIDKFEYFAKILGYVAYTLLSVVISYYATRRIPGTVLGMVIRCVICGVIVLTLTVLIFGRQQEYKELKTRLLRVLRKNL